MEVIDAWLRADVELKGTVIYERLVADYGFSGHYQRVKMYVAEARPRMRAELGIEPDRWLICTGGSRSSRELKPRWIGERRVAC